MTFLDDCRNGNHERVSREIKKNHQLSKEDGLMVAVEHNQVEVVKVLKDHVYQGSISE